MACVLGLMVFNYYAGRRNVLYPAFLFSLIWLVVSSLYMVPLIEVDKLGAYTSLTIRFTFSILWERLGLGVFALALYFVGAWLFLLDERDKPEIGIALRLLTGQPTP